MKPEKMNPLGSETNIKTQTEVKITRIFQDDLFPPHSQNFASYVHRKISWTIGLDGERIGDTKVQRNVQHEGLVNKLLEVNTSQTRQHLEKK